MRLNYPLFFLKCLYLIYLLISSYSILYFIITKQIIYVLYLQLNNLSQSQKITYGLTDFSYSIDHDILSFSFWKKRSLKRNYSSNETTKIEITRQEDSETHLMKIVGKSNDYEFTVDLIHYRIFDIILKVFIFYSSSFIIVYSISSTYFIMRIPRIS